MCKGVLKKIKKSERGLTFILDSLRIGQKFRYVVDTAKKLVYIIPDEDGSGTVSRKKCGKGYKPLVDIRTKEIKDLVSSADYIGLEVLDSGDVLVSIIKTEAKRKPTSHHVHLKELFGSVTKQFVLSKALFAEFASNCLPDSLSVSSDVLPLAGAKGADELIRVYDVISLFSGAGMLDKAFLDGRFRLVYGIDFEPAAVETYRKNIGEHIECRDIRTLNEKELPAADVVIGGVCCQAFSSSNQRNRDTKEGEEKRLLIDDYIRVVNEKLPKVWVIENVPDILTMEDAFYLNRLCEKLSRYEVSATVVSDDTLGGYSVRKRAIIIGSRIGKIVFPEEHCTPKTVREALSKVDATWLNYSDVTIPKEETRKKMSYVLPGGNWRDIPKALCSYGEKTHSCIMRRLEYDKPSITLCNFRKANILHPVENRILSVAEAAAIMGLQKDFTFYGTLSQKQQMVSNGVTQAMAKYVKNIVLHALDSHMGDVVLPA